MILCRKQHKTTIFKMPVRKIIKLSKTGRRMRYTRIYWLAGVISKCNRPHVIELYFGNTKMSETMFHANSREPEKDIFDYPIKVSNSVISAVALGASSRVLPIMTYTEMAYRRNRQV